MENVDVKANKVIILIQIVEYLWANNKSMGEIFFSKNILLYCNDLSIF